MGLSSSAGTFGGRGLVGDLVAEHGVEDVAAAAGEADEGVITDADTDCNPVS
jgi:hypothetical protein